MRLLLVLLLVACQSAPPGAELLQLDELTPTRVDPGATLTIRGRGLPAGRRGRLRLRGRFYRPGAPSRAADVELPVRVVADGRAEATLDRAAVARLGGRGTLDGEAVLSFEAVGGGEVSGRLPIELDVGPADIVALQEDSRRERSAPRALGVVLAEDSLEVRVAEVAPASLAARAGLRPGDRLLEFGGLRVRSGADLALSPEADRIVVERPGVAGRLTLRLPDDHGPAVRSFWALLLLPLVAFWWLGPGAAELRRITPRGACPRPRRWLGMAAVAGLCAALLNWRPIGVGLWLAASLAMRAATLVRASASARLRGFGGELALWMAVAAVCVSTGSTSTGAASADLAHSALARAPLVWGLLIAALLALAGPRGFAADTHRALAATLLVALASGGLGGGWLLVGAAVLLAVVAAWLPPSACRWALPSACVLLPLHVAASFAAPRPGAFEAIALSIAAGAVPMVALLWPRRRVPRIHAYL